MATAALTLFSNFMAIEDNANTLVIMIGYTVGVDLALFVLEPFRDEGRQGARKIDAIERASATDRIAVILSVLILLLALLGLFLVPAADRGQSRTDQSGAP